LSFLSLSPFSFRRVVILSGQIYTFVITAAGTSLHICGVFTGTRGRLTDQNDTFAAVEGSTAPVQWNGTA